MTTQGASAQAIIVTGTVNFIPRFSAPATIANSAMAQFNTNRIGINTSTPQSVLELYNSCENPLKPSLVISHQANCLGGTNVGDFIRVQNGSSTRFIVTNLGRVGIGTITTPSAQFEVQPVSGINIAEFRNTSAVSVLTVANTGHVTANTGNLLVTNGRLGIGVASPTARVEVDYTTFTDALRIKAGAFTGFLIQNEKVGINVNSLASLGTLTVKNADNNGNALDLVANTTTPVGQGWINQIRMSTNSGYRHNIVDDGNSGKLIINTGVGAGATNILQVNGRLQIGSNASFSGTEVVSIDGKVKIGNVTTPSSANSDYMLYVEKGILSERFKCSLKSTSDWSDYVFDKDYRLMSLSDVEKYVKKNKHLPNVPSAQEVYNNGIDLGKMNALLLEKVEELTLHLIKLEKEINNLKKN